MYFDCYGRNLSQLFHISFYLDHPYHFSFSIPYVELCGAPFASAPVVLFGPVVGHLPQHRLYFFPLLHGHGSLRPVPGYFFPLGDVPVVVCESSLGMLGNISWCREIMGAITESRKPANSTSSILSAGRISASISSCFDAGNNARVSTSERLTAHSASARGNRPLRRARVARTQPSILPLLPWCAFHLVWPNTKVICAAHELAASAPQTFSASSEPPVSLYALTDLIYLPLLSPIMKARGGCRPYK